MNETQIKIEKSSHIAEISLKVMQILLFITIALMILILGAVVAGYYVSGIEIVEVMGLSGVAGSDVVQEFGDLSGVEYSYMVFYASVAFLCISIIYLGLLLGIVRNAKIIFSEIRRSLVPFTESNAKRLKTIAIIMAFLGIFPGSMEIVTSYLIDAPLQFFGISIEVLILSVILYALAHIFEYGTVIQKEIDETL